MPQSRHRLPVGPIPTPSFGLYLAETGGLLLSQDHVKSYDSSGHTFELNEQGIARWNSCQHYTDVPRLNRSLFNREFALRIDGQEIARGRFYSGASSAGYHGLAIVDALLPLGPAHDQLRLISDYPGDSLGDEYSGVAAALSQAFQRLRRLKK